MFANKLIMATACLLLTAGCQNSQNTELELKRVTQQRDSLMQAAVKKDSAIDAFLVSFNEIEANLANIRARQESMTLRWSKGVEVKRDLQEEIMEDIKAINELMEQNQKKITSLNSVIRGNDTQIQELNGMVNLLMQHIQDKNQELALLNTTLMEKNKELAQRNKIVFRVPK